MACGFRPRSAKEAQDSGGLRFVKICDLIEACRYAIHDISRTQLDPESGLPRFNMPLELGLFLGARRFGDSSQQEKHSLILDIEKFRYQKFISDLSGMDIGIRTIAPEALVTLVRDWLKNVSRREIPGGKHLLVAYRQFMRDLPATLHALGLQDPPPYADYLQITTEWLVAARSATPDTAR